MLIQGGTISSGTLSTSSVVGLVLDELHQVVLEDHLAGREREIAADLEHATGRTGGSSDCLAPALMSSVSMCMPRTRLSAFDDSVSRSSSGLVSTKFDGEIALAICLT